MSKVETPTFYFSILIVDFALKERYRNFENFLWITFARRQIGIKIDLRENKNIKN